MHRNPSHNALSPFDSRSCPFCSARFSRTDAAKRHAGRCSHREGRPLPVRKRGRRAKACDQCWRVKLFCDGLTHDGGPCKRCKTKESICTLDRCEIAHDSADGHCSRDLVHEALGGNDDAVISFLLSITDDKQDFVTESEIGLEPDDTVLGPISRENTHCEDALLDLFEPSVLFLFDAEPSSMLEVDPASQPRQEYQGSVSSTHKTDCNLFERLGALAADLASHARSSADDTLCFDGDAFWRFCNVQHAREYATVFCRKRHYRYSIIHWPTFCLEDAPLPLLLAVILTGAAYSVYLSDGVKRAIDARAFYHIADRYISDQLEKPIDATTSLDDGNVKALQLCQSALLMYGLDLLPSGEKTLQNTAITRRLPTLINALRRFGFVEVQHKAQEDWQSFIYREQTIRLVSWTFCADCLATLSYNKPPGFSLLEMRGALPCDSALWEANAMTPPDISGHLNRGDAPVWCVRDLVGALMAGRLQESENQNELPPLHLQIALCALQQIIYSMQTSMSLNAVSAVSLLKALDSWHGLWTGAVKDQAPQDSKKLGVAHHVLDLAQLTKRIIKVSVQPNTSQYLQRVPSCSMGDLHEFIREYGSDRSQGEQRAALWQP